jgi:hypothetical protein
MSVKYIQYTSATFFDGSDVLCMDTVCVLMTSRAFSFEADSRAGKARHKVHGNTRRETARAQSTYLV